jgi:hypothetical protein
MPSHSVEPMRLKLPPQKWKFMFEISFLEKKRRKHKINLLGTTAL